MGLLAGNHEGYVHMSGTFSRTGKKTFHGKTRSEHEIVSLFYYKPYFEIFMGKIFAM